MTDTTHLDVVATEMAERRKLVETMRRQAVVYAWGRNDERKANGLPELDGVDFARKYAGIYMAVLQHDRLNMPYLRHAWASYEAMGTMPADHRDFIGH